MMTKIRSLIFRELKIGRKTYCLAFGTLLGAMAMMAIAMFLTGGDAIKNGESMNGLVLVTSYLIAAVAAGVSADDSGVSKADIVTGWRRYSFALPVTPLQKTIAKYAVKLMAVILGFVLSLISSFAFSAIGKCAISPATVFCFFICLDAALVLDIVYQIIIVRATDKRSLKILGFIAGGVVIAILTIIDLLPFSVDLMAGIEAIISELEKIKRADSPTALNNYIDLITIPDTAGFIGIALSFVILAAGFLITLKINERKEA